MLEELRIQNFAIIEDIELAFSKGFNVITGETGAGKSILIDAVELLIGGRADSSMVRAGEERAIIEGTFILTDVAKQRVVPLLMENDLIQEESEANRMIITREMRTNGRNVTRLNGVTCSTNVLAEIGEYILDIHGQHAQMSLFKPRAHVDLLDRYANLLEVRDALGEVVSTLNGIRREIKHLQEDKEALQRRADRLRYEVDEIEAAKLDADEEDTIINELSRLGNSERLAELSAEAIGLLGGEEISDDFIPALDALTQVSALLEKLLKLDTSLEDDYNLAVELATNAQELSINLLKYADEVEHDPNRLQQVEERWDMIKKLKRRYDADTIADLIAHGEKAREELEGIEHSEERLEELFKQEEKTLRHIGELCDRISKVREVASRALSKKVVRELNDLRMENTRFDVVRDRIEDEKGAFSRDGKRYKFDSTGFEQVEFMMSANPGEPMRPLTKVASGGEAARIMLSIKRVLSQSDDIPTLIFDEVDQGIGGRIGAVVGEKLWSLSERHQVLVVTHLAQLASYSDKHYHVSKQVKNKRTKTHVDLLNDDEARVTELADMLGATGESGQQSARELLDEARQRKGSLRSAEPTRKVDSLTMR